MNAKKVKVVNLYAGSGSGKSMTAAGVFYELKKMGYQAEYVTEYAKDLVYDEAYKILDDQIYLFGQQQHRLKRCLKENDFIIMDSPLLLNIPYDKEENEDLKRLIISEYNKYDNIDIVLTRTREYEKKARVETKEQALEMDKKILNVVKSVNKQEKVTYLTVDEDTVRRIIEIIVK